MSGGDFASLMSELTGARPSSKPAQTSLTARPRENGLAPNPAVRSISPLKRKQENGVEGPPSKVPRPDLQKLAINNANRPGSSGGQPPRSGGLALTKDTQGSNLKPCAQTGNSGSSNNSTPTSATASKAPPKGSYRDMLARARAAHATQPVTPPLIQSPSAKPLAPMGRRKQERMEARMRVREEAKLGTKPITTKPGAASLKKGKGPVRPVQVPVKKKKERPPLEYKGTMRGKVATSSKSGTDKQGLSSGKKAAAGYSSASGSELETMDGKKRYTYAGSDDEEDEEEYDSEESNGMEGGGFDELEAEEELSLRVARKEDAAALREEEAHRREKLERKNKLAALAAKAKPPKY